MGKPCMMIPAHVEQECNATDAERELVGSNPKASISIAFRPSLAAMRRMWSSACGRTVPTRASWLPSRALAMNIVLWVRTPMAMLRTRGWCSNALDGLLSNLQIQTPLRKHFPWTKTGNAIPLNGVAECSSFKLGGVNKVVCCDG